MTPHAPHGEGPSPEDRIDALEGSPLLWGWVALLSFGAFFEIYDVFLTAFISPGLVKDGVFHTAKAGLFGLSDQASFAAATFAGLYLGALLFARIADRLGRRPIFTFALVWYALATVVMGLQTTAVGVDAWRLIAGAGVGVELVAIDCYLAELMPKSLRGRAFALSNAIQFSAVPTGALLAYLLVPHRAFGVAGWRWLAFFPAIGAVLVWAVRTRLPESPRWLLEHGRRQEAEAIIARLEAASPPRAGASASPPNRQTGLRARRSDAAPAFGPAASSLLSRPFFGRLLMLSVFHVFQTVGYYGFANWVPTLLLAEGVDVSKSLLYSAAIALAAPLAPLSFMLFADRVDRKWQVMAGAFGAGVFGLLYAQQRAPLGWISLGLLVSLSNSLMSYAYHGYQSELFPTAMRARAVGLAYSFSRLSAIVSSYLIAFVLARFGVTAVFMLIAGSLGVVVLVIGLFGPRTLNRSVSEITS